jgi:hypothetical protein
MEKITKETVLDRVQIRYPDTGLLIANMYTAGREGNMDQFRDFLDRILRRTSYVETLGHTLSRTAPE